ncbi:MAG: UvrD-helicase domain-containing protein [Betaproteobacteria bacterium]|nr:UvrD-helicase domain-containing protein [Betaproteobacteria bacterium]
MIADAAVRERALDPSRSFIVQAPAGSGKTELLIRRYLALLPRVEKPEEILAITFTKKAAAEMKARVVKELPDPSLAHRIRILTIDAFCALLTRQMPVVARFGAQPEIVEDADELYQDAAGRTIAGLGPAVERLLSHLDNDVGVASGLLATMLKRRDQWRRKSGAAPTRAELDAALASERNRLLARARSLLSDASPELAAELLTKYDRAWRKRNKRAQELAGNEPLREALSALLDMPPEKFSDPQWETLDAILGLVAPALVKLFEVFRERAQVDFTGIAHGALLALGEPDAPTDLLLSMDARVRHILVDEFQDTSVSQWELLERLTAGWEAGDGRTVFAVGDPMQSVYRFRDAEVGLFLHARHAGLPNVALEPLALTTNFRSQAGIVDWVNGFFSRALPAQEDESTGAVCYAPSTAHHPALEGDAVTWHGYFDRADEAARVVEIAKNSTGKVAILVRNRTHLDEIVPALKDAGLRFRAVEIEQLGERQVVQDLYALTRALSHPADRIAWLALLRAPWCGLGLDELARYFEGSDERTVWEVMQEVPALQRICEVLRPALEQRLRCTLRDRVEGTWLALGGPACVADATDLEDAEAFLDEIERLEEAGTLEDMAELEARLEAKLYALPDVNAGVDAVEIMTIHKSKGLEFDTVVVPGLDRAPRSGNRPLFAWKAIAGERVLLAPIDETGAGKDPIYRYVRALDREAEDIEAGRLFYVAATRAISRLHLLGCARVDRNGEIAVPAKRSLLSVGWFEAERHFDPPGAHAPEVEGAVAPRADTIRRLAHGFALPCVPTPVAWQAPPEGRDAAEEIEFSWAGETARHVGTIVHRWLQRIAEDGLRGWDAKRVESLRPRFARELERRGIQVNEIAEAAERVADALTSTLADERGRWLLGPHPEARSECRMRTATRGFVVDRMLKDAQGRRWVVDYKTSRHEGADLDGFLDEQRRRYVPQLDAYAAALGNARRGLYFPLLACWREW